MKLGLAILTTVTLSLFGLGQPAADLIAQADAIFQEVWQSEYTQENHVALQTRLQEAIALYEQALEVGGEDAQVLAMLSRCYYMLADIFLPQEEKARTHIQGQEYGERALRADPEFVEREREQGFVEAARAHTHLEALYWTYANWARKVDLGAQGGLLGAVFRGDDKKLRAMMERCLELDPNYLAGGPYRAMGAYWAKHPLRKDPERARELFQAAREAFPGYLENTYFLVQYYLVPQKQWEEAARLLEEIIAAPLGDWPLQNSVVKLRAQELLVEVQEHL
jgi:tetratricopeptide (TPR) repeat protein